MSRGNTSILATIVVIIGAPRSGTNMLRDILTTLSGFATWPCDEINYIWRHGNARYPSDEFTPDMARQSVQRYIRCQFNWVAKRYDADVVVEKTCANSLRVGFIDRVVPETKYVFIRRNGLDALASAVKRWKAELNISYVLRKARFIPASDFPFYAGGYLWNRIYRLVSRAQHLAFWGPKLDGMGKLLQRYTLDEVCALQWKHCVDVAADSFKCMAPGKYVEVAYEDFVCTPEEELTRLIEFLGVKIDPAARQRAVAGVQTGSIGKGREALGKENIKHLMPLIQDTMARYNYV